MRLASFAIAAVIAAAAVVPVQAQDGSGTRIIIRKLPPKSYLDPGTVVKPGTKPYLNYVDTQAMRFPTYGGEGGITGSRYPLPDRYYLPGY
ncbi:MAG: hypothetical protein K0R27_2419 [Xanthobacteraceae bacterium]|jgi:hypothetical protein|nr:hypothetical protein [Xanthobacteraceae bacterium]